MKKISHAIFLLGLFISFTTYAQSTEKPNGFMRLDRIIAVVDREAITQSELDKEMDRAKKQMEHANQPLPPAGEFRKQVLDELIGRNLQMQMAKAKNLKVEQQDVDKTIKNIAKSNNISVAQLKEAVQQTGLNYEEYQKQISDQLLLQKLQQQELAKIVTLTPEDVQKFVRENKSKLNQFSAFHLLDILLPINENSSNADIDQERKQAVELAKQLRTTKEVDKISQQFTNAEINDLGWRSLAEIPSLFQSNVAEMQVNSVSTPLQAPNGFHVLKLLETKGQATKLSETQLKNLAYQQKMVSEIKTWVQKLRQDAYVKIMP